MKNNKAILLDCTLRDGVLYYNWDFDIGFVNKYLYALSKSNVSWVEIGFRTSKNSGYKGPFAFTSDNLLGLLKMPKNINYAVMVNGSEFLLANADQSRLIKKLFTQKKYSKISMVRFACHFHELPSIFPAINAVKKLGYKICINLMQIGIRSSEEIEHFSKLVKELNPNVFYFADSLGSLQSRDIENIINSIRKNWDGDIGIHAHDNLGFAMQNTLTAFNAGATWLDSTITGMGRGPGNVATEYLASEMNNLNSEKNCDLFPMIDIAMNEFSKLKIKYQWGTNPLYYLSGKYKIHPTYVQSLLGDSKYNLNDIYKTLDILKKDGGSNFNKDMIGQLLASEKKIKDPLVPKNFFSKKEILLLGPGSNLKKNLEQVKEFISSKKLLVVATSPTINEDLKVDINIACHPFRIIADHKKYNNLNSMFIFPEYKIDIFKKNILDKMDVYRFGFVSSDDFKCYQTYCTSPYMNVASYALSIFEKGLASKVYLAGFDGYEERNSAHSEVQKIINYFVKKLKIISITESLYEIETESVHSFLK